MEQEKTDYEDFIRRTEAFLNSQIGSLEDNRASLNKITIVLSDTVEQLAISERLFPSWQTYIETLIHKLSHTSLSICKLSEGIIIESSMFPVKVNMIDYPSLCILTRAVLENYLTLDYIFLNNLPLEERLFRFKLWEVSGLISRQKYATFNNEGFEQKKAKEKEEIESILAEIRKMPEYKSLNSQQLNKLKKFGLPRIDGWNTLILNSKLKKVYFSDLYSIFSNYAHSEFTSIMQFRQTSFGIDSSETETFIRLCFSIARSLNSLCIEWLTTNYEECGAYFNNLHIDIQYSVSLWATVGKE